MTDSDKIKFVGLVGYPGVGKDSLADYLVKQYGWAKVSFGDAVKLMLLRIDPAYGGDLVRLESTKRDPGSVTRMKLQNLGQEFRKVDPYFWINKVKERLALVGFRKSVIVPDVRYYNEASFVTSQYPDTPGTVLGITREGMGPVNNHESERFTGELLTSYPTKLENNSTIEELAARLLTVV